jgi:hypothetical protein
MQPEQSVVDPVPVADTAWEAPELVKVDVSVATLGFAGSNTDGDGTGS